jgi:hypothetical protein
MPHRFHDVDPVTGPVAIRIPNFQDEGRGRPCTFGIGEPREFVDRFGQILGTPRIDAKTIRERREALGETLDSRDRVRGRSGSGHFLAPRLIVLKEIVFN